VTRRCPPGVSGFDEKKPATFEVFRIEDHKLLTVAKI